MQQLFPDDLYLTNGASLYRVICRDDPAESDMVELEDCYGLDVVAVPVRELHAPRLRVVVPADSSTPG